jgi:molybdate transport system substrate-binding protein
MLGIEYTGVFAILNIETQEERLMKKVKRMLTGFLATWTFLVCLPAHYQAIAGEKSVVHVQAGHGLKDALTTLKEIYVRKEPQVELQINFAAAGILERQIEEGVPADLFLAPGKKQIDELAAKDLIIPETRFELLGSELVLIVAKEKEGKIKSFSDLPVSAKSISIGMPETVPAGKYAKETLVNLKLWNKLEKRIVYGKCVRQVMAYVDSGDVDAGLVYQSDTVVMKSGSVAAVAPQTSHSPIIFTMAAVRGGRNREATQKFMDFLKSSEASKVFEKNRFVPLAGNR